MAAAMSSPSNVLRIRIPLSAAPLHCEWALVGAGGESLSGIVPGKGLLTNLPQQYPHMEVVLPAADVLITRLNLPGTARRHSAALLAYAVEEATAGDPENNEVSWLGTDASGMDVLAVVDKGALLRWRTALAAAGIRDFQLCCETLLLPWTAGHWSLAWDGTEGFVRTGAAEGSATDSGDHSTPPLSLQLLLAAARAADIAPASITIYMTSATAAPDVGAWSRALGLAVQHGGNWHWSSVATDAGPLLAQQPRRWHLFDGMAPRLRPALWMLGLALAGHALVTGAAWASLATEKRELQARMESRFREVFPEAVAVVDPVLQMRRQLATARQAAGAADSSDFLPLVELVALAIRELPAGSLRTLSYERGRMTLEFAGVGAQDAQHLLEGLRQSGLGADLAPSATDSSRLILTVRPT
jgi:general secretion pathway protein L